MVYSSRLSVAFIVSKTFAFKQKTPQLAGRLTTDKREEYTILKRYFQFEELGTNYRREMIGGLTTFLSMAYILIVNPLTLSLASVENFPDFASSPMIKQPTAAETAVAVKTAL